MELKHSYFGNVSSVRVEFDRDDVKSKSMMNKITRHLRQGILRPSVVRKTILLKYYSSYVETDTKIFGKDAKNHQKIFKICKFYIFYKN